MAEAPNRGPIVIAEDDEDDYLLTMEALNEAGVHTEVKWVKDGEELIAYLKSGSVSNGLSASRPLLVLLDLNMPKKDGREALAEIKTDPDLRRIPVIVLTTSKAEADITQAYDLGVNSFIQKPVRFNEFVEMARIFSNYWFKVVKLPA